jgi:tetratricopeptide (TPR) repeat protein
LGNIAKIAWERGDPETARQQLLQTLAIAERSGDEQRVGYTHNMLGIVYYDLKEKPLSQQHFEQALLSARSSGEKGRIAQAMNNLGALMHEWKQYDQARRYLEESIQISYQTGNLHSIAISLVNLGEIVLEEGDAAAGKRYMLEALTLAERYRAPQVITYTLQTLAERIIAPKHPVFALELLNLLANLPDVRPTMLASLQKGMQPLREKLTPGLVEMVLERSKNSDYPMMIARTREMVEAL